MPCMDWLVGGLLALLGSQGRSETWWTFLVNIYIYNDKILVLYSASTLLLPLAAAKR